MTRQEEISDGVAEFNYLYPDGKPKIRIPWESLSPEGRKPYLDVASLQIFKLHSQGCVLKARPPKVGGKELTEIRANGMNYVPVEPLIEVKE